jgi:pyruvate/2-oxoglutarate dehydrogenase complex dihydrolipoamide dehydrogenase (E3) component
VPTASKTPPAYKAIIIGSGQGGKPLAVSLANAGWKTALIERDQVGGTCINYGCTPTKTMIASARVAHLVRRAADFGILPGGATVDFPRIRQRKRDIVHAFRSGSERLIEKTEHLDLIRGDARFVSEREIVVQDREGTLLTLDADYFIINTGTRNDRPPLPGLDRVTVYDSTGMTELETVPKHLIVIGGGYVGLEFGQMFRRFGSQVTIVQRADHLLAREDDDVTEAIAEILRDEGLAIHLGADVTSVRDDQSGAVTVTISRNGSISDITGSHLMLATGRRPNTDQLGLKRAGIDTTSRGFVRVNERLETNRTGIYAIGDVTGGPAFTHISYDDFRILKQNLLLGSTMSTAGRLVPYTLFIDPQLARVGLSEKEARAAGIAYRLAKLPMAHVARALEMDETRGFIKALVDPRSDLILGCAVLGVEGGELMAALHMAMIGGIRSTRLRDAVIAHPTLAESLNSLFTAVKD